MYIRRPLYPQGPRATVKKEANNTTVINIKSSHCERQHSSTLPPLASRNMDVSDKIEIDSDNIETPPATRKLLTVNKPSFLEKKPKAMDNASLGDGQFDRYSAARRTRRYKKNIDEENSSHIDSPVSSVSISESTPKHQVRPNTLLVKSIPTQETDYPDNEDEDLMYINKSGEELKNLKRSATLPRSTRFRSIMNRKILAEDTYKPLKTDSETTSAKSVDGGNMTVSITSSPTAKADVSTPSRTGREPTIVNILDNLVFSSKVKSEFVPEVKIQVITPNKHREQDMRDEGFEESQSLVSETMSQGTSSGNFEQENISPTTKTAKLKPDSSDGGEAITSNHHHPTTIERNKSVTTSFKHETKPSVTPVKRSLSLYRSSSQNNGNVLKTNQSANSTNKSNILTLKNTQSNVKPLTRSKPVNPANKPLQPSIINKIPLEKTSSKSSLKVAPLRKKVERSNSKSSLQSSRSSLNSSSSVNTVRPAMSFPGIRKYTDGIRSVNDNIHNSQSVQKPKTPIPASRSSSSGSSIGPTLRKTMRTAGNSDLTGSSRNTLERSSSSGSNFMRPTAASTAKDAPDPSLRKLKPKLRSFK